MPELPEVEVVAQALRPALVDRPLRTLRHAHPDVLQPAPSPNPAV